ncbi:alpha/beta hydrolase family protein [Luteolibacter sp. Populi]|uniref:alpha/beta hydrolase family protein n=1 Tax=Luteolibacter sp. Populi TaxID=3230487 RepID=UPI00346748EF
MNLNRAAFLVVAASARLLAADPAPYDPLKVADTKIESQTFEVKDAKRDRALPIRVYLPASDKPAPVVLFSHGLGGSRDNNPYLGNHWAKRGYAVVFVQHPGSDESVWKDAPAAERMADLKKAASLESYLDRGKDIPAVIDALAAWNDGKDHALHGRLDLEHLGMSGHSFGAQTTQAVAGQSLARGRMSFVEPRIDAAVMMSPSPPAMGDPAAAFASIKIPCLLMTGTLDDSPIGNTTPADRLKVFPHLNQAAAWQVVFDKATHMAFGERGLKGESPIDPRYHRAILALTTAFWDAELKGDPTAKSWLNGESAKSVLIDADKWESNAKAKAP